jgi:DNA polymerase I-like protein with 3'-5' exonuclease and polymerase domains
VQCRTTKEANELLLKGQIAYARMQAAGVRVDKRYLDAAIPKAEAKVAAMEAALRKSEVAKVWEKVYGAGMKFGSRDQLADVLFNKMGFASDGATCGGRRHSTNRNVLEKIDDPFVRDYLRLEPMKKAIATNLVGIRREMVQHDDGHWYVHPFHSLNTVQSFRPSSSSPNWRNYPKRNKEITAMVRPAFIPRPGRYFQETDQAQIEVRVPVPITGDANLRRYVMDKSTDMHRDSACELFFFTVEEYLKHKDALKPIRSQVKNNFVFASFYDAAPHTCAKRLWDDIGIYDLKAADGTPLKKHLAKNGITSLGDCTDYKTPPVAGTFLYHVKACQDKLWKRFKGYRAWKDKKAREFREKGALTMVTGFVVAGPHKDREVTNYLIQGPAYHITLKSIIHLQNRLRKYKMRTILLGDIYDSIQSDVSPAELQDWTDMQIEVMTQVVPCEYDWLEGTPLEVEVEVAPQRKSWHECEEWANKGGVWSPA